MSKKQTNPQAIRLLELLAHNASVSSKALLEKYGEPEAISYDDLEAKLSDIYKKAKDKVAIEKEFANIHPHKDFILKYLSPTTKVILPEPVSACSGENSKGCEGCPGKMSSAEGVVEDTITAVKRHEFLIASVAIVGIVALVIYSKR